MKPLVALITQKTLLNSHVVENILKLLSEGATIPFIARYRKELTGAASDEVLRTFETIYDQAQKLLDRKEEVKRLIGERATLTGVIEAAIQAATSLRELEDIYVPYKEQKTSKATVAISLGLSPLAELLQHAALSHEALVKTAQAYVTQAVPSIEEAIKGAQDIVAQTFSQTPWVRSQVRFAMLQHGYLEAKASKSFNEQGLYVHLVAQRHKISSIPSHRYLALMRGVKEKECTVKVTLDVERMMETLTRKLKPKEAKSSWTLLLEAYEDGLKRLLLPSIEREVHAELKTRSDEAAIGVFGKNLQALLMTQPVVKKVILGVDPGFRTGCKLAVIDAQGTFLDHATIFPTAPHNDYETSTKTVLDLVKKHAINAVAIGNGTASRETQAFFATLQDKATLPFTVVSEAGASVYSASKIASLEYPHLDVTVRGAISIAQRVRDPMAALVKIDPKSLGIGQYQHDVDAKLLEKKLGDITQDLVNRVGVDLNSASASLLAYVAGIGTKVAQAIVAHRALHGPFKSKQELLKVKGLGAKAYEQAAGFVRIKEGSHLLDNTGVHPESFEVAKKLLGLDRSQADIKALAALWGVGVATLGDIMFELDKPGFDPRAELEPIPFREDLVDIKMLQVGSIVSGVVRNIADFGAFVDIGLKNDGLIHISKIRASRVAHPLEVLSVNDYLAHIEVIGVDYEKQKVSLSLLNTL